MKRIRTTRTLLAAAALIPSAMLGFAAPAQATERDGRCDAGEFCYYYNSDNEGSVADFMDSVGDYGASQPTCYEFKGAGNGKDVCVKNNAASVWNRSTKSVRVYYGSGYAGPDQEFAPGARANLAPTLKNENASHQFLGQPSGRVGASYLNGTLRNGQSLSSPNGVYRLTMADDGDVEVNAIGDSRTGIAPRRLWSTASRGAYCCDNRLVMQTDGNLVIYQGSTAVWATDTDGVTGARLAVQDDGNVVLYDKDRRAVWSTRTAHYQAFDNAVDLILREMQTNGADMARRSTQPSVYKLAYFWSKVRVNGAWDHKPILRRTLPLTTRDSLYLEVRGIPNTALYYDYWSNLHYGYVGTLGGISVDTLIKASEAPFSGNGVPMDRIAVMAGVDLAHRVGPDLTEDALIDTVLRSVEENRGTDLVRSIAY